MVERHNDICTTSESPHLESPGIIKVSVFQLSQKQVAGVSVDSSRVRVRESVCVFRGSDLVTSLSRVCARVRVTLSAGRLPGLAPQQQR